MVLGTLKTNPQYSIGKAQRAPMYEIIKTPGPIYKHDNLSTVKEVLYIHVKYIIIINIPMMKIQIFPKFQNDGIM